MKQPHISSIFHLSLVCGLSVVGHSDFFVKAIHIPVVERPRGFQEVGDTASHRRRILFECFEISTTIAPRARLSVAAQDVIDVNRDSVGHDLMARLNVYDRL